MRQIGFLYCFLARFKADMAIRRILRKIKPSPPKKVDTGEVSNSSFGSNIFKFHFEGSALAWDSPNNF